MQPVRCGRPQLMILALAAALVMPARAEAADRPCGWALQVSGDQVNAAYPDGTARYWVAILPIPPGGHVEVAGRYPHARYTSLHTYTPATQAIDALADVEIAPDRGSRNPFLPRATRRVKRRAYTVKVVNERMPATGRVANTLYTENADGSKSSRATGLVGLELRIYQPDDGRDVTGDAGLPRLTLVRSDGSRTAVPACPDASAPDLGYTAALASLPGGVPAPPTGLLGHDPPRWRKYTNAASLQVSYAVDSEQLARPVGDALVSELDARLPSGGAGENMHNKYIYAPFSREFGDVLILRGALPSTPRTRQGQRRMGVGQLRYWSLCANAAQTSYFGCVTDDDVVVDRRRRYTIAVSTSDARPSRATSKCGVTWLPAGPLQQAILVMRNMLPAAGFAQAIQRVTPGTERETMGRYYPQGTYYATAADADEAIAC